MKKLLCLFLILVMAISLVACVDNESPDNDDVGSSQLPGEEIYPGLDGPGAETPIIPYS